MIKKGTLNSLAKEIFAGGDKDGDISVFQSDEFLYPVIGNGIENEGICGYSKSYTVESPAITIAARGSIGATFYRKGKFTPVIRLITIIADEDIIDTKYLYYLLKNNSFNSTGSVQQQITVPQIKDRVVYYEDDLNIQKKIASLLALLDEKIANNSRINTELESIAKTLYDYWFIQFEFPNEDGKPYKSSGGKMVWNEVLKRDIPEGWGIEMLKSIFSKKNSTITPEKAKKCKYTPIDTLPCNRMSFGESANSDDANSSLITYNKNDLLFGAMRAYFHRVCIAPYYGVTRTTTFVLEPKNIEHLGYCYQVLNMDSTVNYAVVNSVGTQQPYAVWDDVFENMKIVCAPDKLKEKYSKLISKIIDKVQSNELENVELASLRNFLLPLLMNGQATFKETN